jgi:hypothetical protein
MRKRKAKAKPLGNLYGLRRDQLGGKNEQTRKHLVDLRRSEGSQAGHRARRLARRAADPT